MYVSFNSSMTGNISWAGSAYLFHKFIPNFKWSLLNLVFCEVLFFSEQSFFIWPFVCSSSICGFWLPLWYLLITSLISSDYLFDIFWLPLWYLLITSLISSSFTCGMLNIRSKIVCCDMSICDIFSNITLRQAET
jgi:hypothetical protein